MLSVLYSTLCSGSGIFNVAINLVFLLLIFITAWLAITILLWPLTTCNTILLSSIKLEMLGIEPRIFFRQRRWLSTNPQPLPIGNFFSTCLRFGCGLDCVVGVGGRRVLSVVPRSFPDLKSLWGCCLPIGRCYACTPSEPMQLGQILILGWENNKDRRLKFTLLPLHHSADPNWKPGHLINYFLHSWPLIIAVQVWLGNAQP